MKRIAALFSLLAVLLCGCTSHRPTGETTQPTDNSVPPIQDTAPTWQMPCLYDGNIKWDELHVYDFPERCSFAHSNVWLDAEDYISMNREEALAFFGLSFDLDNVLTDTEIDHEDMNYGVYYSESRGFYETENRFSYIVGSGGKITMILRREDVLRIFPQEAYDAPNYAVINGCNVLIGEHAGENREIYVQLALGNANMLLRFRDISESDVLAVLDYLTMQSK